MINTKSKETSKYYETMKHVVCTGFSTGYIRDAAKIVLAPRISNFLAVE